MDGALAMIFAAVNTDGAGGIGSIILLAFIVAALSPILVSSSTRPSSLQTLAIVMCLISIVGTIIAFAFGGLLGGAIVFGSFAMLWLGSLIVACASFLGQMHEKVMKDAAVRLVYGDVSDCPIPKKLQHLNQQK